MVVLPPSPLPSRTIRRRLIWLVLVTAVPLIAFAVGLVLWQGATGQRLLREDAVRTAGTAMRAIDREVAATISGLQVLAASPALAQHDFQSFHAQAKAAVGIAGDTVIILADAEGNRPISTVTAYGTTPPRLADMSPFALPFTTGKPHVTRLLSHENLKEATVGVIVPVVLDGRVKYVLGTGLLSQRLSGLLTVSGLPDGWVAALLDQDGTIIGRTRNAQEFVGTKALPEVWQRMQAVEGSSGSVQGTTKEGAPVTLNFARSDASGWVSVVGIPTPALEGRLRKSLALVGAAAVTVLLAASLLAWLAARQISEPANRLLDAARSLEEGREVRLGGTGIDQFDRLAEAMRHADGKIREREASLHHSLDELGEAHRQLREEQSKKDLFIATLAHELRNPLAPIRTGVDILGRSPPPAVANRTLALIDRQLCHMVRLIDDLLDVSRIARGKLVLQQEDVPLQQVLNDAADASEPLFGMRGQKLVRQIPQEPIWVHADAARLAQVFTNILNNAAKFSAAGEIVVLAAQVIGEEVEVTVADRGVGLSPEHLQDIFELFNQVKDPTTGQQPGLGIGLSLAKRLVELHGGAIHASSAGLGHGTTVTVRLALSLPHGTTASVVPMHDSNGRPALRVLVVDDNVDAADMLATVLRMSGHGAHVAHDGAAALAFAQHSAVDVAILDIGMPGMDGYQLCRQLRQLPRYAKTKIIALTGWGAPSDREKTQQAGFDAHLTKPVDWPELEEALYDKSEVATG